MARPLPREETVAARRAGPGCWDRGRRTADADSGAPISAGRSVTRSLPACIRLTRSQRIASSMYGVETTIGSPSSRRRASRSQNSFRETASTPVVGSSRNRISGRCTSAQQSASFCFMPPDSAPARRLEKRSSWTQIGSMVFFASATVVLKSDAKNVEVLEHAQVGIEGEAPRHVADTGPQVPHVLHHVAAEHRALAGVGEEQRDENAEQRRLPRAVGADDAVELARRHVERHLLQRRVVAESARPVRGPRPPARQSLDATVAAIVSSPGIPIRSRPSGLATRDLDRVHLVGPLVARLDRRRRELRGRRDPGDPARHRGDRVGAVHAHLHLLARAGAG